MKETKDLEKLQPTINVRLNSLTTGLKENKNKYTMFCVYRLANIQECLGNHGPISRWNHGHPCVNWLFTKHGSSSRGNDVMLPLSDAGEETLTMLLTSRDGSKGWSPGPLCPVSPAPEARAERQCVSVSV